MKKLLLITIALCCLIITPTVTQAAGLTLWSVADQVIDVDEGESIAGRLGYYFGSNEGGLELAVGSTWYLKDDKPQVMSFLVIEHFPDLIDPDNTMPWIPDFFLVFINEDVEARPYAALEGTFNFIEEDMGYYGGVVGVLAKLSPESRMEYGLEGSWRKGLGELEGVDRRQLSLVIRYPF